MRLHARTEVVAGCTTYLTMVYIVFVQPAMLSGRTFGTATGMDLDAVFFATCVASAIATLVMGLYARYPIALAPGMGINAFGDGLALGFLAYPLAKVAGGRAREVRPALWVVSLLLVLYFVLVRARI